MKIEHAVCTFCGSLCDDLSVTVMDNRIQEIRGGCSLSRQKLLHGGEQRATPRIAGREVSWEEALDEAARLLSAARHPLVYGLSSTSCEAQRLAVRLAERLGGTIDSTSSICHGPGTMAKQAVGMLGCTLGEVKNRADLVIFWGCNPAETHQRHLVRYSVTARGMYVQAGRQDRKVVVVDVRKTATARLADLFLMIRPGEDYALLSSLRALLKGYPVRPQGLSPSLEAVRRLLDMMRGSRYGVLFYGMGLTMTGGKDQNTLAALKLVRDLNEVTRFCALPMRGHGNVAGSENVLAWTTGYPFGVNFSRGYPRYNPGEFTAVDLLVRNEVDACLVIASDPGATMPAAAGRWLASIPTVVLDAHPSVTAKLARVVIPTAAFGFEAGGTAYRMDDVPLRVKKLVEGPYPGDAQTLELLLARLA